MVDAREAKPFLSPDDLNTGDVVTIDVETTHTIQTFTQGDQKRKRIVLGIVNRKPAVLNNTSVKAIQAVFGHDTAKWVGQKLTVVKAKSNIQGQLKDVLYFEPVKVEVKKR